MRNPGLEKPCRGSSESKAVALDTGSGTSRRPNDFKGSNAPGCKKSKASSAAPACAKDCISRDGSGWMKSGVNGTEPIQAADRKDGGGSSRAKSETNTTGPMRAKARRDKPRSGLTRSSEKSKASIRAREQTNVERSGRAKSLRGVNRPDLAESNMDELGSAQAKPKSRRDDPAAAKLLGDNGSSKNK